MLKCTMNSNYNYDESFLKIDEFGRSNGIVLVDKPKGVSSHDIVDDFRKKYFTKKVGHAGTLDPFASGLLIILVGKATKRSDDFLKLDKEYIAEILFGKETDSGDPEGEIVKKDDNASVSKKEIENALKEFTPEYNQFVPVYSSVKVEGQKLRKLARKYESFKIRSEGGEKFVDFLDENQIKKTIELPSKKVKLYELELLDFTEKKTAKVRIKCSKGTYIRQLAIDLGKKLNTPAMLINLRRTTIGNYNLNSDSR